MTIDELERQETLLSVPAITRLHRQRQPHKHLALSSSRLKMSWDNRPQNGE